MKQKFKKETAAEMRKLLSKVKTSSETKRVQAVLLGSLGARSHEIAPIVNWTPNYVRKIWKIYREEGAKALVGENRGQNRGKAQFTLKEEMNFLRPFFKNAIEGKILEVGPIKKAFEKKVRKKVDSSVIYKLLARHGWRKIMPRSNHPKADSKKQKEFKDVLFPPKS